MLIQIMQSFLKNAFDITLGIIFFAFCTGALISVILFIFKILYLLYKYAVKFMVRLFIRLFE